MSTTSTRTTVPAADLKGGDFIPGVGEVFDTAPHADARFVIVRVVTDAGVQSLALLADARIEVQ